MVIALPTKGQSFDQITRPVAILTNPNVMQEILSDLLILSPEELTSIQMVDITSNGYGPDDLLILNPTLEVHYVGDFIPPSLRSLIAQWDFDADFRYDVVREVTSSDLITAHLQQDAAATIAGSCVNAIDDHYEGDDISMLLHRDGESVRVELWGYDPSDLSYGGASESASCEINRQRFQFARPITVRTFRDRDTCVEAWGENGNVRTRRCTN